MDYSARISVLYYGISHLAQAAQFLGNGDVQHIDQLGERLPRSVRPFSVLPEFAHLIGEATSNPLVSENISFRTSSAGNGVASP